MKVLFDHQIFSNPGYGGIPRYFVEMATQLSKYSDVEVQVLSPIIRSPFLAEGKKHLSTVGIDLSKFPKLPQKIVLPTNAFLFRMLAGVFAPDIVHETYYARDRTAPKSAKIVTTIHDTIPERLTSYFPKHERTRENKRRALRRADRVICVSESTRRDLLEMYEVDPERVSVVRLGSSMKRAIDGAINIGAPYFLHVGARREYKNFHRLIEAFGASGFYRTHYLVSFSADPFRGVELSAMDQFSVPRDRVVNVGGDDKVLARYYAGADALVFPSLYEGFGIPLLEAMLCGCPIVTSYTSCMPEVAGNAAIYCDPEDVNSISNAMVEIASSPSIRASLISNGLERAKGFSWEKCTAETYAIYKSLS